MWQVEKIRRGRAGLRGSPPAFDSRAVGQSSNGIYPGSRNESTFILVRQAMCVRSAGFRVRVAWLWAETVIRLPAIRLFQAGGIGHIMLRDLDTKILCKLPERLKNDPQVREEAGRLVLEAVASRAIAALAHSRPSGIPSVHQL